MYLGGPETPIRAGEGSGLAEISAIQGVAPPDACRRVSLEIDFSGLRGREISALAVDQVYLGGPETQIRTGKCSAYAEISVLQGRTTHRNHCIEFCSDSLLIHYGQPGDAILSIDGRSTAGQSISDIRAGIVGIQGSSVRIGFQRNTGDLYEVIFGVQGRNTCMADGFLC